MTTDLVPSTPNLPESGKNQSWGGPRPNAGRPVGAISKTTRNRREVEEQLQQRALQYADMLFNSQFTLAIGCTYVYRIDEITDDEGKRKRRIHTLVEDPEEIRKLLDEHNGGNGFVDDKYYFITTRAPDSRALDSIMDRTFGKASQKPPEPPDNGNLPTPIMQLLPKQDS